MKAQISGQAFIYIFAMIVAAAIMVFGYEAIHSLISTSEDAEMQQFQANLKNDIKSYSNYGTEKKGLSYPIGGNFRQICFADNGKYPITTFPAQINDPSIQDAVSIKTYQKNVFPTPNGQKYFFEADQLAIEPITGQTPINCFDVTHGVLVVDMIGCGPKTIIKTPTKCDSSNCQSTATCTKDEDCKSEYCASGQCADIKGIC